MIAMRTKASCFALWLMTFGMSACCFDAIAGLSTLSFVRESTGLALSPISDTDTADDAEMSCFVYGRLGLEEARTIAAANPVIVHADGAATFDDLRHQETAASHLPHVGASLHRIAGCTSGHAWRGFVDPEMGDVWLEVLYPDWSGDLPACPQGATESPSPHPTR